MNLEKNKAMEASDVDVQALVACVLDFVAYRDWDSCGVSIRITDGSVNYSEFWLKKDSVVDEKAITWVDRQVTSTATHSVRSIRDEHLRTTGRRIWGLTFTLYPDGKYHIEYDYQKPADYEDDPADTIDGDEINQRLQQLQAAAPAMPPEQAYQQIGYCLLQALGEGWQQASIDIDYRPDQQVMMHFWQHDAHGRQQAPQVPPQASMVAAANAAYALLDNLLAQGGQAAQGLTLHLDPGGKMQLHYHYAS